MGRNKKKKKENGILSNLNEHTISTVLAIVFFVLAIFFVLAAFSKAGLAGNKIYLILEKLFGLGYYLIPLSFLVLSIAFIKAMERSFSTVQWIGSGLFFISSLALLEILITGKGGVAGKLISSPLLKLFDFYASIIILIALILISLLVVLNTSLHIRNLLGIFSRFRKEVDDDLSMIRSEQDEDTIDTQIEDNGQTNSPAVIPKISDFSKKKDNLNGEEIPINSFKSGDFKKFTPPPISLLEKDRGRPEVGDIKANANIIKRTLQNFGIVVEMDEISIGPSITRYALKPAEGVKLSKILGLQNNLELALAAHPVRIEAPIPGKSLVGIEIPNNTKSTVGLATLFSSEEYRKSEKPLLVALGKGISGISHFANLAKMPHILIAGATGSGKSVTIHAMINSLLFRNHPENIKFIMIDPKRVELTLYNKIPHLLTPVITEAKKAILALKWASKEMDRRYDILEAEKVRDIESYHKNILAPATKKNSKGSDQDEVPEIMPYIVVIIDELADIMQAYPRELESAIVRLAQMSRAVGIHLILSTQRPSVNVITGLIKANIPSRVALQVASQIDSRTILDTSGAEKLLGAGDMLYMSGEMSKPKRIQSAFISETEVKRVTKHLTNQYIEDVPDEIDFSHSTSLEKNSIFSSSVGSENLEDEDELYEEARETVIRAGKASTSYLQRKLRVGYARAARLVDILEERGVVGPGSGSKPREVLDKPVESDYEEDNNSVE